MPDDIIGKEFPGPKWYVERGKIGEFASAFDDKNPVYFDAEAAGAAGLPAIVAPPTFAMSAMLQNPPGQGGPDLRGPLKIDPHRMLAGETEFEFTRPLYAGDVLQSFSRVAGVTEKEGRRGGKMRVFTFETVYRDEGGNDVLVVRNTLLERGSAPSAS
jgi:acyl dehydratase